MYYKFNEILLKTPTVTAVCVGNLQADSKTYIKMQETNNNQNNSEAEDQT